jgi:hypothetical protein
MGGTQGLVPCKGGVIVISVLTNGKSGSEQGSTFPKAMYMVDQVHLFPNLMYFLLQPHYAKGD